MSKIALIHGSTIGVTYSIFRKDSLADGNYAAYRDLIDSEKAILYRWCTVIKELDFWQCLNPRELIDVYKTEQAFIHTQEAMNQMREFLMDTKPTKIVAHSMGCHYVLNYLNTFDIPQSTTSIITLMSDAPFDLDISHQSNRERFQAQHLHWFNYYCQWDQALVTSHVINQKARAGQFGAQSPLSTNIFWPLKGKTIDLHTSIIQDLQAKKQILEI